MKPFVSLTVAIVMAFMMTGCGTLQAGSDSSRWTPRPQVNGSEAADEFASRLADTERELNCARTQLDHVNATLAAFNGEAVGGREAVFSKDPLLDQIQRELIARISFLEEAQADLTWRHGRAVNATSASSDGDYSLLLAEAPVLPGDRTRSPGRVAGHLQDELTRVNRRLAAMALHALDDQAGSQAGVDAVQAQQMVDDAEWRRLAQMRFDLTWRLRLAQTAHTYESRFDVAKLMAQPTVETHSSRTTGFGS